MAAIDVTEPALETPRVSRPEVSAIENKTPPVKWLAAVGALVLAFEAYVIVKWVSGPFFERVPQGPSDPPKWMQVELLLWQIFSIPAAVYLLWRFVVKPYVREKKVGTDGVLLLAFASMWFQDPLSSAGNHWFVYNTSMVNFGSWANDVPWFNAFGEPGKMTSEPILFTPAAYVYIMLIGAACGCWFMRRAKNRWPNISTAGLVAVCFVGMCLFDVVLEGIIWLPLGVFEYPGGHWSIFPSTYHKYPLNETITIGAVFTAIACLRYFKDDRGNTWAERGIEKLRLSPGRSLALRALAVTAVVQAAMFIGYNVPNTAIGFNSTEWPRDLQKRSYFTNSLCGQGTDRACPGNGTVHITRDSAYPNTKGGVTDNSKGNADQANPQRKVVPFDRGAPGGDD